MYEITQLKKWLFCCHCEERSDEAISMGSARELTNPRNDSLDHVFGNSFKLGQNIEVCCPE